ncbi:outer membrane receptor protein involved in Fe transport [Polymorphobacter multimanifer]|uniref:Outer membrane receptor protein involved in Fe transport n=1 Tax=Polymorphobacter multimanifer TaxID=1070431 RepID=A0A841L3N3_9SPHN|nr:TonB-dependent receptor [Polymorphobacter multimanifer]MBB6226896.1 outer membrane receptor protein involved in Fe transport [Polymorphobacter multimanifer]
MAQPAPQQTAQAAPDTANDGLADEIVITAQKIEQRLVDVPVTVTAYSGRTLRELGVTQFDQLSAYVPGLNVQEQSPNNPGFVIRGITSDSGSSQGSPAVTVYLNGIDVSRSRGSYFDLYDLERVEVVKGPQSTLFGTAAAIGVVSVITNKARPGTSGELRAAYGNFNQRRLDGFVNFGNDTIALRVAGAVKLRNGVVPNIAGQPGSQTPNGPRQRDLNGQDQYGARVSLRYTPTDAFTLDVVGTYDGQRAPGTAFTSGTFAPTGGNTSPYTFVEVAGSPRTVEALGDELGLVRNVYDVNATATYNTDGPFSFTTVAGYRNFDSNEVFDADGTQAWYLEFGEDARGEQISAEGRINYTTTNFRAFGGMNYFWEKGFQRVPFSSEEGTFLQCAANLIPGLGCINNATGVVTAAQATALLTGGRFTTLPYSAVLFQNEAEIDALSFFGDATWVPVDALELSVGGRYLIEGRDSGFSSNIPNTVITGTTLIPGGTSTGGVVLRSAGSNNAFLPRANILFRATDNINLYATWSKGRRSPVVNLGARRVNGQVVNNETLIAAEKTTNYEIGVKGNFGAVNFNLGAYLLKYRNFQVSVREEGSPITTTQSAGSATNKGIEAEITAALGDNLSVFANGAYIDAKVDDDPRFVAFSGDRFRLQSKFQFAAGGTLTLPLSEQVEFYATPTVTHRSSLFFELPNNPVTSQGPVTLVNLRAGFQHPEGRWQITGFATNLTDKKYLLDAGNTGGSFGIPTFIRGLPRLFGVEALYRF